MPSRVKLGLAGGLSSLVSGSVGAYLGLQEKENEPITKVLSLDSQSSSGWGRCKIRMTLTTGAERHYSYTDFYKEKGDPKGALASGCLEKLTGVDKSKENAMAVLEEKGNSYVIKQFLVNY